MKKLLMAACLSVMAVTQVYAADAAAPAKPEKQLTPQQEKMKACNAEAKAKALKGDERKGFMKTCLSKDGGAEAAAPAADKKGAQREKMKSCNADAKAKGLKGEERKTFMSSCLKN